MPAMIAGTFGQPRDARLESRLMPAESAADPRRSPPRRRRGVREQHGAKPARSPVDRDQPAPEVGLRHG